MIRVYKKKNYDIYSNKRCFIVYNRRKKFSDEYECGHTHINNYNAAKHIINLCIHKTIPNHLSKYLLESIIRLSDDRQYIEKIKHELNKMAS